MSNQGSILNLNFYKFTPLENLEEYQEKFKEKCVEIGLKGLVIFTPEGVNSGVSGEPEAIEKYKEFLTQFEELSDLPFKESWSEEHPFKRMLVKIRDVLVPMEWDGEIRVDQKTGKKLKPLELKKWLDENKDFHLLDCRNIRELRMGSFRKAADLGLVHFRDFAQKFKEKKTDYSDKPVVMYCTGGIRCEKATAVAMEMGVEDVYQLDGGILKYFEECGGDHYDGECFVFDYRVAVDPKLEPSKVFTEFPE